jgi:hypothetical protein
MGRSSLSIVKLADGSAIDIEAVAALKPIPGGTGFLCLSNTGAVILAVDLGDASKNEEAKQYVLHAMGNWKSLDSRETVIYRDERRRHPFGKERA